MKYKILFLCLCLVFTSGCASRFHIISIKANTDPEGVVIRTRERDFSKAAAYEVDHYNQLLTDEDIKKGSVEIPELVIEKPGYKKAFIHPDPIKLDKSFWFSAQKLANGDFEHYYELPGEIYLEKDLDEVKAEDSDTAEIEMSPELEAAPDMEEVEDEAEAEVPDTEEVEVSAEPVAAPVMEEVQDAPEAEVPGTAEVEVSSETEDDPVMEETPHAGEPESLDMADVDVSPEPEAVPVMEEAPESLEAVPSDTADDEMSPKSESTPALAKGPILAWTTVSNKVRVEISSEPTGAEIYESGKHVCTAPCIRTYKLNNENYESGWLKMNKLVGVLDGHSKEISPEIEISPEWKYHAGKTFEADYGILFLMGTGTINSSTTYKISGSGKECAIAKHDYMEAEAVYNSEKSLREMHGNESAAGVGGFNTAEESASLKLLSTTSMNESTVDHEVMNHALLRMQNAKGRISIHCGN